MSKGLRLGAAAAGVVALLGVAVIAEAQNAPAQINQRQEVMKANGAAAKTLTQMVRGEQPWDQQAAHQAAMTLNNNSKQIPTLFPQGSGQETGVKTAALATIWQNKADFDAKAKAMEEETAKLMAANDEAAVKAQFPNVGKTCGGCHENYRAKQQ